MINIKPGERIDDLQRNNLKIIQDPGRFCFGMDAVLLSGFVASSAPKKPIKLLDMCTGTGIIPILLYAKMNLEHADALEIQTDSADMARRSVALNELEEKINITDGDIKEASSIYGKSVFDMVTVNPPYMADSHGLKNPKDAMAIARHEILCTLEDVIREGAAVLKPGGKLCMVHRPHRVAEIFGMMNRFGIEPKRMQLVYPYVDKEPNMVLIEGARGGKSGMVFEKPIIVYEKPGEYTKDIYEIYGY